MKVVVAGITTLCVLGVIAVALRWLVGRSRAKIVLDPTCARCGYITAGLPGSVCPECGANLSRPGAVLRPRAVRPMGVWQLMFCWSVVFGLGFMAIEWGWLGRADRVCVIQRYGQWDEPNSRAYDTIRADYVEEDYRESLTRVNGVLTIRLHGGIIGRTRLVWDSAGNTCRITDGNSAGREMAFDRDAVASWMHDNGIDSADPRVRREAETVAETCIEGPLFSSYDGFRSGYMTNDPNWRPTRAVQAARGVLWLGWLAGLVWLWRRSRRAWRVAVVTRGPDVAEQEVARVDEWDETSLRGFE